jgi:predicted permease
MIAEALIYQVGLLFLMLIPGILLAKCGLSTAGLGKGLANLVLYIAQPALIVVAYVREFDQEILSNAIWVFIFSILSHFLFAGVAFFCFRHAEEAKQKMLRFATIFSNAAYMGIPLIVAVLNEEAAIYASVYNITFNLFLWSLGVIICTGDKKQASVKKVLLHPVTISAAIGLAIFLLPIDTYVPTILIDGMNMLKSLVEPLSMIIIGLRLANLRFKGIFRDRYLYEFLFLRMLLLPAAIFVIMKGLSFVLPSINETVMTVILVTAATPAATATSMFAEKYDGDATYAGTLVSISTLIAVLTMPIISLLLNL